MKDYLTHTYSDLIVDVDSPLLWVTLNRPQYSNSFSDQMISDLCRLLREADWDDDVRVVILTGAGKNFCAGGDVKAMEEKTGMFAGDPEELRRRYTKGIQQIPITIESLQTPIIAMVNGAAIGAGCDLACMCDMRIGCRHSRFGETFAKLALVPGDGGAFFLQRVVGYAKAMELSLTGRIVTAEEALALGLLNTLVEEASLKEETGKIARMISGNSPVAVSMIKKAIRQARTAEISGHLDLVAAFQGITQRTADHFEGVRALKEKREPHFKGQ
ncbi:EchA3: enoyl-CoA hydratase/isomerase [Desulfosarcina variabilis str. Montpellier]|uniref:enoyl-CoA hydratase-related protein n=1 Tax=Desulfosarcina variabilis TaxID=2300 RepID=UPI003AFB4477